MHPKLMILLFLTSLPTSICSEPILEATGSANGPRPSAVNQEMYLELLQALEQLQHGEPKNKIPEKRKSIYERAWHALAPSHEFKEGLKVKQSLICRNGSDVRIKDNMASLDFRNQAYPRSGRMRTLQWVRRPK